MKKSKLITLSCLITLIWLITGNFVHAAAPVIKDFSSNGGHARNKDNAGDVMYLVKSGDKITFKVKADGAEKYEWLVNKAVQKTKTDTFTWSVPKEKGIWEIHLTAGNNDGATHQEWVVSTLTKSEAPVIFDFFYADRSQKDPWGRPMPKWDKKVQSPDHTVHAYARGVGRITIPTDNSYGTWIFQRRYRPRGTKGGSGYFGWRISGGGAYYTLTKRPGSEAWDFRGMPSKYGPIGVHCMGRRAMGECCSHMGDVTDDWDEVRIVRTKDGWFYIWIGGELWFESLANENTLKEIDSLRLWSPSLDCVQVYDRPVWPGKSIRFGEYTDDIQSANGKIRYQVKRKGIVIDGHGVTLANIAEGIKDPKLFRYDPATQTATCYTDLVIRAGAELVIDGGTLKMHCNKDGEHQIRVKNCSSIRLNKATITSANKFYYLWAFTSACRWEDYKRWASKGYASCFFSGRFLATDSTISNCANFFPDTPGELVLKRCKLVDLVEIDAGNYWKIPPGTGSVLYDTTKRMAAKGKKGLWFYNRKELVDFRIEDCVIHGKDKPIDITFIGGDDLHKVTISNCVLDNVVARKGYRFRDWREIYPRETEYMSSTINLLNCKFKKLEAQGPKAWILPKYYLDVLAVDKAGKPIPGCKVRLINEINDVMYPAENLAEKRYWVIHNITQNRWIKFWLDVNDLRAAVPTGKDGHTAAPDDKTNTLVLTDFIQNQEGRQEFTYTVQATAPDGRFGEIKGVNPGEDWYRKDPNRPVQSIKVVLDKPSKPAPPARKHRPVIKTDKSPWPSFRGSDYAHTGRSPHTGPSKPRLLWRHKTNGEIFSSPVIGADGTIYVTADAPDRSLYAINPDGSRKWRLHAKPAGSGGYFAPALGLDGTLYAGVAYGRYRKLLAISPEGKLKWEYEHPSYGSNHCFPIPTPDGTIYYAGGSLVKGKYRSDYRFFAISPDGKSKWAGKIKDKMNGVYHGPFVSCPAIAPDGAIYMGSSYIMRTVHALNPDGTSKWSYGTKGRVLSSPALSISDKTVYIGSREGRAWTENVTGHLLAIGFDGTAKWKYDVADEIGGSPAVGADGTVYFGSRDGWFYALDKNGKLKWKFQAGDYIYSSPAIDAEGKIYFGSHDHYLYCLSPKGKLLWKYLTGGSVVSSPAIGADGTVYTGSADGYLYAFGK